MWAISQNHWKLFFAGKYFKSCSTENFYKPPEGGAIYVDTQTETIGKAQQVISDEGLLNGKYCKLVQWLRPIPTPERRLIQIYVSACATTDTWITCTDHCKSAPSPVAPVARCKLVYLHHFAILTFKNSLHQKLKVYKTKVNFAQLLMFYPKN